MERQNTTVGTEYGRLILRLSSQCRHRSRGMSNKVAVVDATRVSLARECHRPQYYRVGYRQVIEGAGRILALGRTQRTGVNISVNTRIMKKVSIRHQIHDARFCRRRITPVRKYIRQDVSVVTNKSSIAIGTSEWRVNIGMSRVASLAPPGTAA